MTLCESCNHAEDDHVYIDAFIMGGFIWDDYYNRRFAGCHVKVFTEAGFEKNMTFVNCERSCRGFVSKGMAQEE